MNYCSHFMALEDAKWIFNQGLVCISITKDDVREVNVSGNEAVSCCIYQLQLEHLCGIKWRRLLNAVVFTAQW